MAASAAGGSGTPAAHQPVFLRGGVQKIIIEEGTGQMATPFSRVRFVSRACVEEVVKIPGTGKTAQQKADERKAKKAREREDDLLADEYESSSSSEDDQSDDELTENRTRLLKDNDMTDAWLGRGTLIEGLEIALLTMRAGERAHVLIPAERGYGAACHTFPKSCGYNLHSNSVMSFEVHLKAVTPEIDVSPVVGQRMVVKHIQFIAPVAPVKAGAKAPHPGTRKADYNSQVALHIKQVNEFTGRPDAGQDVSWTVGGANTSREQDCLALSMSPGELSNVVMLTGGGSRQFLIHCKEIIPPATMDEILDNQCNNNSWPQVSTKVQKLLEEGTSLYKASQYFKANRKYLEAANIATESARRKKGDGVTRWSSDMWAIVSHAHLCAGESLLHDGDYAGSIAGLTKSISICLEATGGNKAAVNSHAFLVRGQAHRRLRQFGEALADLQTFIECKGGAQQAPPEAIKELADTVEEKKHFEEELSVL